jgi:predicted SAM-dependent methyltransferase
MQTIETFSIDRLIKDKQVLHFAPESLLTSRWSGLAAAYMTADLHRTDVDLKLDICEMSEIPDQSLDLVIACDVLEHVADDGQAIDEMYRVLRTNGWAVLTVPQKDGLKETYEDKTITTDEGRTRAFGRHDHLRIYGDDFVGILEARHFTARVISEADFKVTTRTKHVLIPPIMSEHPLATNHRKVFFAQKRA